MKSINPTGFLEKHPKFYLVLHEKAPKHLEEEPIKNINRECPSKKLMISIQDETVIGEEYQQIQEKLFGFVAQT